MVTAIGRGLWASLGLAMALAGSAAAQTPAPAAAPMPAIDYSDAANWLCRPGRADACSSGLDAVKVDLSGARTPEPFKAAADPKVDCFYVYPTVSRDQSMFSDMNAGPEETATVRGQAARFSARCRVFAPVYRQLTGFGLGIAMRSGGAIDWSSPYVDVLAAWKSYLAHDNHGRGVILIGHSQGTILLTRLLQEEIEGKPVANKLIAAYLVGSPGVLVPKGADVGVTFKSTPLCRAAGQTGCVVVWSSYDGSNLPPTRIFANSTPSRGWVAACVNPAALGGGKAPLDSYLPRPQAAPASDPPYVEIPGGYAGECVTDDRGSVLQVTVQPGAYAELRQALLTAVTTRSPTWGLHGLDVGLAEGDLLKLSDSQIAAYLARH